MNTPFLPGTIYHIYTHANGNENLFRNDENYDYFLKKYEEYISPVSDTFVYCLMPNHFHFLVRIKNEGELDEFLNKRNKKTDSVDYSKIVSQQWSHFLNGYSQAYNKMFDRRGSLFQPRIRRKEVNKDTYFTTVLLYIHWNPVRHGFVNQPVEWSFSSIHEYLSSSDETFLFRDEVIKWFGNIDQFLALHKGVTPLSINIDFD